MKIAFDAKRLFYNHTGLGNYSRSLVENIKELSGDEHDIYLFTPSIDGSVYTQFISDQYKICEGKGRFLWRLKNMVKDIDSIGAHIYHGLSNELPVGISRLKQTKTIVTIHDLIFLRYPEYYPKVDRILYREKSKRACKIADHIIAVSEATKRDIIHFFNVHPEKISVIYQAFDNAFLSENSIETKLAPVEGRPFILYVGSISERKNLKYLLEALAQISKASRPMLKIVGKGGAYEKKMRELALKLNLKEDVEFLGHIGNADLRDLYRQARCLVYPSFYEGFGIPIIEALISGTQVICSNASSMPEAGLGFSTLIDPNSVEEISSAIELVLSNQSLNNQQQIEAIHQRFNPRRHAQEVVQLYHNICKC